MSGKESRQRRQRPEQAGKQQHRAPSRDPVLGPESDEVDLSLDRRIPTGFGPDAFQQHASLLGDHRLAHSANTGPRQAIARGLQRQYGNDYVRRLVDHVTPAHPGTFQPKLTVGPAGDKYEQEADRVAKQVVSQTATSASAQRMEMPEEEELQMKRVQRLGPAAPEDEKKLAAAMEMKEELDEKKAAQKKSIQRMGNPSSLEGGDTDAGFESAVQAAAGKGAPLPEAVRTEMEAAFGRDFGKVRVHTDAQASTLNREVQALAFTTGPNVFFREGHYAPGSPAGKETLAHELTHVVQQGGAAPKPSKAARKREPEQGA